MSAIGTRIRHKVNGIVVLVFTGFGFGVFFAGSDVAASVSRCDLQDPPRRLPHIHPQPITPPSQMAGSYSIGGTQTMVRAIDNLSNFVPAGNEIAELDPSGPTMPGSVAHALPGEYEWDNRFPRPSIGWPHGIWFTGGVGGLGGGIGRGGNALGFDGRVASGGANVTIYSDSLVTWNGGRTYGGLDSNDDNVEGWNWRSQAWADLAVNGNDITVTMDYNSSLYFEGDGSGGWKSPPGSTITLTHDGTNEEYRMVTSDLFQFYFHDHTVTNTYERGRLKKVHDANDNGLTFTYDGTAQDLDYIDETGGRRIDYSYTSGRVSEVDIYSGTPYGSTEKISQVLLEYSGGDLELVTTKEKATNDDAGDLSIVSKTLYRYWADTWSTENPGADHKLKMVVYPKDYELLATAIAPTLPVNATEAQVADYASIQYEYKLENSEYLVSKTVSRDAGCDSCSTYTVDYTWDKPTATDANDVASHVVADSSDGSRTIIDWNSAGNILTWVFVDDWDATTPKKWRFHNDYGTGDDDNGQLLREYEPATVTGYNESTYAVTTTDLDDSKGHVHEYSYSSVAGVEGSLTKASQRVGETGTLKTISNFWYAAEGQSLVLSEEGPNATAGADENRSYSYTFHDAAKLQLKEKVTTLPLIPTSQNGSGQRGEVRAYYDTNGRLQWTKDALGYVNYYGYDSATGLPSLTVIDVNTTTRPEGVPATPTTDYNRGAGLPTALDVRTDTVYDDLGRVRTVTRENDVDGVEQDLITFYAYTASGPNLEVHTYRGWDGTDKTTVPTVITVYNKAGQIVERKEISSGKELVTSGDPVGSETYSQGDLVSLTKYSYSDAGALESVKEYHDIPSSGDGSAFTNYYQTSYKYETDATTGLLRRYVIEQTANTSPQPTEQVWKFEYDARLRVIKTLQGVSDESHDIGTATSGWSFLKRIEERYYDDPDVAVASANIDSDPEHGIGIGLLSWVKTFSTAGASVDVRLGYDGYENLTHILPEGPPYTIRKFDENEQLIAAAQYNALTDLTATTDPTAEETGRFSLALISYDNQSNIYRIKTSDKANVEPETDILETELYYDLNNRIVGVDAPNSGYVFAKYDGAGRSSERFASTSIPSTKYVSGVFQYPGNDDGIIQHTGLKYDALGNALEVVRREMNHNDADGLDIDATDDSIRTYSYRWFDLAGRITDSVYYGTNDSGGNWEEGTKPPHDADGGTGGIQIPARSDAVMRTTFDYDIAGNITKVTDPKDNKTVAVYDDLARVSKEDQGDGSTAELRTEYQYDGLSNVVRHIADPGADNTISGGVWTMVGGDKDQVTEFVYEDALDASLVTEIRYATGDGTVGTTASDKETFTYNYDGSLKDRTDQNGTKHAYAYDSQGRLITDTVKTYGTYTGGAGAVDSTAKVIQISYDNESRVEYVTTHDGSGFKGYPDTTGFTTAINQVKREYDVAGRLTKESIDTDGKVDSGSYDVDYTYDSVYTGGNHSRLQTVASDARTTYYGYDHTDGTGNLQDAINDAFGRVGQVGRGDTTENLIFAQYDFNGLGRVVRRTHPPQSGTDYGNGTRMDLWHGTSGEYAGLDHFGRVKDLRHTTTDTTPVDILRRNYSYDRNSNPTDVEHVVYKSNGDSHSYDARDRLTETKRGTVVVDSGVPEVEGSDTRIGFTLDKLGNFDEIELNTASGTESVLHATNDTNEIITLTNKLVGASRVMEGFPTGSLTSPSIWSVETGTWAEATGDTVKATAFDASGDAILLTEPVFATMNYKFTVDTNGTGGKYGLVFSHDYDGSGGYYAVVYDDVASEIALWKVPAGDWTNATRQTGAATTQDDLSFRVFRRQRSVEVLAYGASSTWPAAPHASFVWSVTYDLGTGPSGLYSNDADMSGILAIYEPTARNETAPRMRGAAEASVTAGKLYLSFSQPGGEVAVDSFRGDDYMVTVQLDRGGGTFAEAWVRYSDTNNGYRLRFKSNGKLYLDAVDRGSITAIANEWVTSSTSILLRVKLVGTKIQVWTGATERFTAGGETDTTFREGGVAFNAQHGSIDDLLIGYDDDDDDDLETNGDDNLVVNMDFAQNYVTPALDHAGNLIDDKAFVYIYDAWHRLVKVRASQDSDVVVQTAKFDGLGRRIEKVISNSGGSLNGTLRYLYDGNRILANLNGYNGVGRHNYLGTQYIDEVVKVDSVGQGAFFVHQDRTWNVIATTDMGGNVLDRFIYDPYGRFVIHKWTDKGDRTGNQYRGISDRPLFPISTVTGADRIVDFDDDGDYDSVDEDVLDDMGYVGLLAAENRQFSEDGMQYGHQGLPFDAEIGSYYNRARQYHPGMRRFLQRDPLGLIAGQNSYEYLGSLPTNSIDPFGLDRFEIIQRQRDKAVLDRARRARTGLGPRPPSLINLGLVLVKNKLIRPVSELFNAITKPILAPNGRGSKFRETVLSSVRRDIVDFFKPWDGKVRKPGQFTRDLPTGALTKFVRVLDVIWILGYDHENGGGIDPIEFFNAIEEILHDDENDPSPPGSSGNPLIYCPGRGA